ncbi:hypothetical protein M3Y95_00757200 [Aphelenchoides besseyi]|nr:hypothetical protein M3Y95_00757200 [Aphelenchoides besseyi]
MWSAEQWTEFLKKYGENYPEVEMQKDAAFLAEQVDVWCFNMLLEHYYRNSATFKSWFPDFSITGLTAFIKAMERYVREKEWIEFLKKHCDEYPECDLQKDAMILEEQRFSPSVFHDLIKLYGTHPNAFKNWFPGIPSCNLVHSVVSRNKRFVCEKEAKEMPMLSDQPSTSRSSPMKKRRIEVPTFQPCTPAWIDGVKKYVMYFTRGRGELAKRYCVAVSPTMAVTYSHGDNVGLTSRNFFENKTFSNGSFLDLHYYFDTTKKPIRVEVVSVNHGVDCILLEAVDGQKFFCGDIEDHIFEVPKVGQEVLAIGLSSDKTNQEAIMNGVVLNDGSTKRDNMVVDFVSWPADFWGGMFSRTNGFLGIAFESFSLGSVHTNFRYKKFAPSTKLKEVWMEFLEDSEQIERRGLRREDE